MKIQLNERKQAMSKPKKKEMEVVPEAPTQGNPDVVIINTSEAAKLSPRGEGGITYQVGRVGEEVYVRIVKNHGGGSCSKEWVPVEKIRACLTPAMRRGEPFKTDALAGAFVGRSQCNSGFLVAVLRAERIFSADPEKKGFTKVTDDIDAWEKVNRQFQPLLNDDGQPVTVKLHPEPKENRFQPKQAEPDCDVEETPEVDSGGQDSPTQSPDEVEVERKPIISKLRSSKRQDGDETDVPDSSEPETADESTV